MANTKEFENKIKYVFKDKNILISALSHSSYANENGRNRLDNNERLEFLGDAVLEYVISRYIYLEFSDLPEGELTKMRARVVCEQSLAKIARGIDLGDFLLLGKGEESTGGRERNSILADAFEAVIGAINLDGGMAFAEEYVLRLLKPEIEELKFERNTIDFKTSLQEIIQKNSRVPLIYEIVKESGPDHNKNFIAHVKHDEKILGIGQGRSKKEAEQMAAGEAIKKMKQQ